MSKSTQVVPGGEPAPLTKADLLNIVFRKENFVPKTVRVTFFGVELELRQPKLKQIFEDSARLKADKERGIENDTKLIIDVLLHHAFIPGTNDHLFDESHVDQISELPQSADFNQLVKAYTALLGGTVDDKVKN